MKQFSTFILLSLLCFAHATHATTTHTEKGQKIAGSYVLVQAAQRATVKPIKDQKNAYLLTLEQVDNHASFFTERPNRIAGTLSITDLLKDWDPSNPQGFAKNPPNGSLAGLNKHIISDDKNVNVIIQLTNPTYNAKTKTLTYVVTPVGNHQQLASLENIKLEHATLFIDAFFGGYCASCVINNN